MRSIILHIEKVQQIPNRIKKKKSANRCIIIKILEPKDRKFFTAAQEKWTVTCQWTPIRVTTDFSSETGGGCEIILKVLK